MKNLCGKTVKRAQAYEVWSAGTWTWYVLIGTTVTFTVGYLASLVFNEPRDAGT